VNQTPSIRVSIARAQPKINLMIGPVSTAFRIRDRLTGLTYHGSFTHDLRGCIVLTNTAGTASQFTDSRGSQVWSSDIDEGTRARVFARVELFLLRLNERHFAEQAKGRWPNSMTN
jgi:hypothetical protein